MTTPEDKRVTAELRGEKGPEQIVLTGAEGEQVFSVGDRINFSEKSVKIVSFKENAVEFLVYLDGQADSTPEPYTITVEVKFLQEKLEDLEGKIEDAIGERIAEKMSDLQEALFEAGVAEIDNKNLDKSVAERLKRNYRTKLVEADFGPAGEYDEQEVTKKALGILNSVLNEIGEQVEASVDTSEIQARRLAFQDEFTELVGAKKKAFAEAGPKITAEEVAALKGDITRYINSPEFVDATDSQNREHLNELIDWVFDERRLKNKKAERPNQNESAENRSDLEKHALDEIVVRYISNPVTDGFDEEMQRKIVATVTEKVMRELFTDAGFEKMRKTQISEWVRRAVDAEVERNNTATKAEDFANTQEAIEFARNFGMQYVYTISREQNLSAQTRIALLDSVDSMVAPIVRSSNQPGEYTKEKLGERMKELIDSQIPFYRKKEELQQWVEQQNFSPEEREEANRIVEGFKLGKYTDDSLDEVKTEISQKIETMRAESVDEELFDGNEEQESGAEAKEKDERETRNWRWNQDFNADENIVALHMELDFFEYRGEYDSATDKAEAIRNFKERVLRRIEQMRQNPQDREEDTWLDEQLAIIRARREARDQDESEPRKRRETPSVDEVIEDVHKRKNDKERRTILVGERVSREIYQVQHQDNAEEALQEMKEEEGWGVFGFTKMFQDRTEENEDGEKELVKDTSLDELIDALEKSKKKLKEEITKELAEGGEVSAKVELMKEQELAIENLKLARTRKDDFTQAIDDFNDHGFWGKVGNSPLLFAHAVRRLTSTADARNSLLRAKLTNAIPSSLPGIVRMPLRAVVSGAVGIPKFARFFTLGVLPAAALMIGGSILNWSLNAGMDLVAKVFKADIRKLFKK